MTANDILHSAFIKLNYTDVDGAVDTEQNSDMIHRAMDAINYIYADICHVIGKEFEPIPDLGADIKLPADVCTRVMPWGVAMMLAQSESDSDSQALMSEIYNRLRNSFARKPGRVHDVLPKPWL